MLSFRLPSARTLTAALSALAIAAAAMSVSAKPARALETEQLLGLLLGAAAVALIVRSYSSNEQPPADTRYAGRTLPAHCQETIRVSGVEFEVYNSGCLQRAGMTRLPEYCERTIQTNRGPHRIHDKSCLLQAGYQAEQRPSHPRPTPPPTHWQPPHWQPPHWQPPHSRPHRLLR